MSFNANNEFNVIDGTVFFNGEKLTQTSEPVITGRQLEFNNNYNDVEAGESFDFEMSANAEDYQGTQYTIYWIFTDTKGDSEKELDSFDYDNVDRVVAD